MRSSNRGRSTAVQDVGARDVRARDVGARPGRAQVGLLLCAGIIAGCGSPAGPARVPVAGTVSLDGTPIKAGSIRFIPSAPTTGPAAVGEIRDGAYALDVQDGPVAGTLRVEIEATGYQDFDLDDERAYAERAAKGKSPLKRNPIPPKYNRHSTLTANLTTEGNRQLNFLLNSQGKNGSSR